MIKKTMYPKTKRVPNEENFQITEKMDGSNLTIFKKDGDLYVAQRNYIFKKSELDRGKAYPGLIVWLEENGEKLENLLENNEAICCEWIGMGKIKYREDIKKKRIFAFALAYVDKDFNLSYLNYDHHKIHLLFHERNIDFIERVPLIDEIFKKPTIEFLDNMYETLLEIREDKVEGLIIYDKNRNGVEKYVRMKNGKLSEHVENVCSRKEIK